MSRILDFLLDTPNTQPMNLPDTPNLQLLPLRYPQGDLFICDVADAVLKDIIDQLGPVEIHRELMIAAAR